LRSRGGVSLAERVTGYRHRAEGWWSPWCSPERQVFSQVVWGVGWRGERGREPCGVRMSAVSMRAWGGLVSGMAPC